MGQNYGQDKNHCQTWGQGSNDRQVFVSHKDKSNHSICIFDIIWSTPLTEISEKRQKTKKNSISKPVQFQKHESLRTKKLELFKTDNLKLKLKT